MEEKMEKQFDRKLVLEDGSEYYSTSGVFASCTALTTLTLGRVESIGSYAFYACKSLTEISFTDSLVYIGDYAFMQCTALKSFTVPNSVESIGAYVFDGCSALPAVYVASEFERSGFSYLWADQSSVNMTNYVHVKYGA